MPITKSAKKALRQSIKRKARNLKRKAVFKALVKQEKKLLEQKNIEDAQKLLPQLYKALDKAAHAGILKPNAAARKKSRLTKLLSKTAKPTT